MGRAYSVREASIKKSGALKGKLYTMYAKEIFLAAKNGVNPDSNINLKRIIEKAKKDQVPNDIINRAIDKAKGGSLDDYTEVIYEGFGPGDSTIIIKCLTDNVNRTVALVRNAFTKINKSLGVKNSVMHNYDYLGLISVKENPDDILESLIKYNIDFVDIEEDDDIISVFVKPEDYNLLKDALEDLNNDIDYLYDEVGMFPKMEVKLNELDMITFNKLINLLNEIDDVDKIYHNVNLGEE